MSKFEQIVNEQLTTINKTVSMRYPRQIKFSEDFLEAIKREYYGQIIKESPDNQVKNRPDKFLKALRFVVEDIVRNQDKQLDNYRTIEEDQNPEVSSENTNKFRKFEDDKKTKQRKEEILDDEVTDENSKYPNDGKIDLELEAYKKKRRKTKSC